MSKWLSTGEMVDKIKVGEVAETEEGYKVIKNRNRSITYTNKESKYGQYLAMDLTTHRLKWRILPNYVSFQEAMDAMNDGRTVYFEGDFDFHDSISKTEAINIRLEETNLKDHSLIELINGKWTIEEVEVK